LRKSYYAKNGVSQAIADYVLNEFTPIKFQTLIEDSHRRLWVVEQDDNLCAYVTLNRSAHYAGVAGEIETLYVQAHFLRRGLGAHLLAYAREQLKRESGSDKVWLKVNAQNQSAIQFYLAQGFIQQGEVDFMLDGVAHKNWVMVAV
jgi:ribosomal protein S18 acetylase RimI-like enzyme